MSVNFGAGLAPVPNNPNAHDAPPPQQPVAQPNAPTVGTTAAIASPLDTPVADGGIVNSTEPTLKPRQVDSAALKKLRADWIKVDQAILAGDIKSVHRILDEGLEILVKVKNKSNSVTLNAFPKDVFKDLQDIGLIDRFINLFAQHHLQSTLHHRAIQAGNSILLRRLVQSGVEGCRDESIPLSQLAASALRRGDAEQLDACFQLKKEIYPKHKLDWNSIWLYCPKSSTLSLTVDTVAVLVGHLKAADFSNANLAFMFQRAAETGVDRTVSCLVDWFGDAISQFAKSVEWKDAQDGFSLATFTTLVKGGFPREGIRLPSSRHEQAQEYQLVLFGPKLSNSPFAKVSSGPDCAPKDVINFVFQCAFGRTRGSFLSLLPLDAQWLREHEIANALFENGVTPPLAIKIAQAMRAYLKLTQQSFVMGAHGLSYLTYLNECVQPDSFNPLQDPLSIEQAKTIHDALLTVIEQKFGGPLGFFSRALACIGTDGAVNASKLDLIYLQGIGLPTKIVAQIGRTLQILCAEVMAGTMPLNLFKPGMTGVEFQAVFHRWIQQGVAQRIVNRLPQDLGRSSAKRDWSYVDEDSDGDDAADLTEAAELISPVNYLVTSVIRQYGADLAENIEVNSKRMVEACRALPADAFQRVGRDDADSDSSDDGSSSADEDSDLASSS